jgi:hypothetical protein
LRSTAARERTETLVADPQGVRNVPEGVEKDKEGIRTMTMLGENMAWLMKKLA